MKAEQRGPYPAEMEERKRLLLAAYAELAKAREEVAHRTRVYEGYKMLAMSGFVLSGESVSGAEKAVQQWLK